MDEIKSILNDARNGVSLSTLKDLRRVIIDCAKNIKSNDETFKISTLPDVGDRMTTVMSQYVDMVQQLEASQRAFNILYAEYEDPENHDGCEEELFDLKSVQKEFADHLARANENVTEEAEALVDLNEAIQPQPSTRQDEEIVVESPVRQVPRDPITKKFVKIAVKNSTCKHIYDKISIENYFELKEKAKQRVQCPVAGCQNRNMKRTELLLDDEINKLIDSR